MKVTSEKNAKIEKMTFASVYPHYVNKIEKKGRTIHELHKIINWLTGFDEGQLQNMIEQKVTFKTFFKKANIHPNAYHIKGVICGYRIEDIDDEFAVYKQCRYLDKLVDELAKGHDINLIMERLNS